MKERVHYIDMAKGFAMVTIVMLHIVSSNLKGDAALMVNFFNGSFGTMLFFFLSGMVVAVGGANFSRWKEAWDFVLKKIKTLLLPFVVWSVLIMPYIYERSDIHDFFQILIAPFVPPFYGYWFLLYLFVIQMVFMGIKVVSSRLSTFIRNDFVREMLMAVPFSLLLFPIYEYVLIFLLGYFFLRYGSRFLFGNIVMIFSLCLFVMLFTLDRDKCGEDLSLYIKFIMALSGILSIMGVIKRIDLTCESHNNFCELLCFVGCHSLEVYLLHYYLTWICRDVYISVTDIHAIPLYFIVFAFAFLICILCCYIADVLKKNPYISFMLFGTIKR